MNDRILWDIIDGLRDELSIAQDGITDLNDVVKDLQAEIKLDEGVILARNMEVDDLKAENVRLNRVNAELSDKLQADLSVCKANVESLENVKGYLQNKMHNDLRAENERLKNGFGHGVLVELEQVDSLKDEIKELKADNKRLYQEHKECAEYDNL